MNHLLKYDQSLVPLVYNRQKETTWRINDEKGITGGDTLVCQNRQTGKKFAEAIVTSVSMKTFGTLSAEDKRKHEPFTDDTEMLETYSRYYGFPVTMETPVKVIHFNVLRFF